MTGSCAHSIAPEVDCFSSSMWSLHSLLAFPFKNYGRLPGLTYSSIFLRQYEGHWKHYEVNIGQMAQAFHMQAYDDNGGDGDGGGRVE